MPFVGFAINMWLIKMYMYEMLLNFFMVFYVLVFIYNIDHVEHLHKLVEYSSGLYELFTVDFYKMIV